MDKLSAELHSCFGVQLADEFVSKATYHHNLDFVEYVSRDCFVVSERIDEFLTVLKSGDSHEIIGFKLKGFAYVYYELVKPIAGEPEDHFLEIIDVLLAMFSRIGDAVFADTAVQRRRNAYKQTAELAREKKVKLELSELPVAA